MSGAVRGGIWTAGSRVIAQGAQFAIFLVAVRILTPAEFGIFALVTAWTVILAQFSMAGWPEYVMQWSGDMRRPREVLTVSFLCGIGLALVGWGASLVLPGDKPESGDLLRVLALWIPFVSLGATYAGILNWQDRLAAAAIAGGLADIATFIVAVAALLGDMGVISLAYGRLAGGICWAAAGLFLVRVGPALNVPGKHIADLFQFATRIIAMRLLHNMRLYAGTLLVGLFLGAAEAGYFRAAQRLVSALSEVLGEPTRVLSWSLFRAARNAQEGGSDFRETANRLFPVILICSVPLFATMGILSEDIVRLTFGPGWEPAARIVLILSIAQAILSLAYATEAILSLGGHVRLLPWLTTGFAAIAIGLTLLAAPHGMEATAWAQVISAVLTFVISAVVLSRYGNLHWREIGHRLRALPPALAAMILAGWGLASWDPLGELGVLARLGLSATGILALGALVLLALDAGIRRSLLGWLRGRKAGAGPDS